jgi:NAD(P)-dependent dehydrogenase (short-subunit alcohol dehydrogenase family)
MSVAFAQCGANYSIEDSYMSKLTGKVAVITGGSSGIGLATAKRFIKEGAYVYITGRRQSQLVKAKAELGSQVSTVQGDVADLADLDALYKTIAADKRKVDIVVASAGFVEFGFLATATPEHFDKTFNINARGVFFTVQKALPLMNDGGSIILVSSCVHLKERSIRVNCLSPGATDTPIFDGQFKSKEEAVGARKAFAGMIPLGRLGEADELASAAYFLASGESSYVTGADLVVDGGWTQL